MAQYAAAVDQGTTGTRFMIFDRQGMAISFSEHYKFVNDQGTWRFVKRLDGAPWLKGAITLADPQGSYTVSPYVYHND